MTAPVTPAATVRPVAAQGRDAGGAENAAPFASALDGVLSGSRAPARDAGGTGGRHEKKDPPTADSPVAEQDAPGDPPVAAGPATPPGVAAVLWALLLGSAGGVPPTSVAATAADDTSQGIGGIGATPGSAAAGPATPVVGLPTGVDLSAALLEQATVPAGGLPEPVQQDAGTAGTVTTTAVARSASTLAAGATPAPTVTVPENVAASPVVPAAGGPGASSVLGTTSGVAALVPSVTTTDDGTLATAGADAGPDAVPSAVPSAVSSAVSTAASSAVAPAAPRTGPEPLAVVDGPTHDGATAPATGGAVLPGAVSAAGGPSAGSGDPGREPGGSDSSSPDATPGLSAAAPGSAPAAGATARVDDVAAPAGPPVVPPVSGQIARHLAVMRGAAEGAHSMTLVLRPEHLGPVEIQLTIAQGSLDLSLRGAHEHGRAALLQALPDLRRDLETAGLNCSKLEVDRDTGGAWTAQQHNPGDRRAQQEWSAGGVRTATRAADTGESRPMTTPTRSTSPGVDVRV